jgi:lipoprotein-anchoring transpeptidase ErfK/SrfK
MDLRIFWTAILITGLTLSGRAQTPSASPPPISSLPSATPAPTAPLAPPVAPLPTITDTRVVVSIPEQKLAVIVNNKISRTYKISTSRYGEGDNLGSWRTPLGHLVVATKIGSTIPVGGVFERRQFTGEILSPNAPGRDPIVSRIIWLRGIDGTNRNAYSRCIYIHGTPQEDILGKKASFGCVRMSSTDVVEIFNWVTIGTDVAIVDKSINRAVKDSIEERIVFAKNSLKPIEAVR